MIWCLIILLLLNKKVSLKTATIISFCFYLFNLFFTYAGKNVLPGTVYEKINIFWTMTGTEATECFLAYYFCYLGNGAMNTVIECTILRK